MYNCFSRSFCILKNRKSGSITTKEASIISVNTIKKGKKPLLELLVLFENFSGYHIHRKIRVWDSKPHLKRFEPDKTIPIGLNIARKPKDPVFLSQQMCRFSFALVIICTIKLVVYAMCCYIFMGEVFEMVIYNHRKYEAVFKNSHTWEIGLIFIGVSLLLFLLLQKIGVLVNGKTLSQNWNLLYYGIGATATVTAQKNMGTLTKNNMVQQLSYIFKNHWGKKIEGSDKKIVEKDATDSISESDQVEIMYLPNDTSISRITENLESQEFTRFLNVVFMVVVFIFSMIFVVAFYKTVVGA
ncbi:hypothetical protein [Flagellimonas okinawensis]|uniref:Uncharacterized protein n=1 Tax=Flagellimonas okinawensis TaxID=3031324 RepID=A0ABT5XM05_9FLAO|nr:hypothetical protein [[Muricauda] okinawensis]MDF0706921.1 hypothetical protein [[Muricauda] okinawensis]